MFEFSLAETLGMTVARLRDELTEAEFAQWYAFYEYKAHRARQTRGGRRGGA